ncbi:MAG TPA: SDR family NAD(P)-dependent oxidoreductase [Acidimicrobiales bacterium]|nr:SDR family NAD(P)-dependent oxidoreductase [Acidimicrobiales bacterium]
MARRRKTRQPRRFDGQVAVVTGASSGIGRALALTLAERGAIVVGLARRKELLDELAPELARSTSRSTTAVCDVADADAFRDRLDDIERTFGRIDNLVNNAGVDLMLPVTGPPAGASTETAREVFDVNFFSVVTGSLAVLPGMLERGHGVIVNVSSDSARAPEPRQGAYAASKAAISAFSGSIAHEVAPAGVHVHVLYPAWVPTAMGLSGAQDGGRPPKAVRRTADGVANLTAERMGGPHIDINASWLPLLAPIARTIAPLSYQKAMQRMHTT